MKSRLKGLFLLFSLDFPASVPEFDAYFEKTALLVLDLI